jgi:hypothetical protein
MLAATGSIWVRHSIHYHEGEAPHHMSSPPSCLTTPLLCPQLTEQMSWMGPSTSKHIQTDTDPQSLCPKSHNGSAHLGTRPQEHPRDLHGLSYDGLGPGPGEPLSYLLLFMLTVKWVPEIKRAGGSSYTFHYEACSTSPYPE